MQPFTVKTVYTLVLGVGAWWITQYCFPPGGGVFRLFLRSTVFLLLYGAGVLGLKLSDDVLPVWNTVKKRLGFSKDQTS
jgi:hypothetical protein